MDAVPFGFEPTGHPTLGYRCGFERIQMHALCQIDLLSHFGHLVDFEVAGKLSNF
jgi:hypothetical protein